MCTPTWLSYSLCHLNPWRLSANKRVSLFVEQALKTQTWSRVVWGHASLKNFWILHFSNHQKCTNLLKPEGSNMNRSNKDLSKFSASEGRNSVVIISTSDGQNSRVTVASRIWVLMYEKYSGEGASVRLHRNVWDSRSMRETESSGIRVTIMITIRTTTYNNYLLVPCAN